METTHQPILGIVMCTYNGEKYISAQIESIIQQTFTNYELLILDDGSIDNTVNLIQDFIKLDKRIKLVVNETNLGINKNIEKGVHLLQNEYIAITDQDDIWLPTKLEEQLALFNKDINLVYCNSQMFEGQIPHTMHKKKINSFEGNDARKLVLKNTISGHQIIFHNRIKKHLHFLPSNLYYDWYISFVAASLGNIKCLNKSLVWHRKHENNVSVGINKSNKLNDGMSYQELVTRLNIFLQVDSLKDESAIFINNALAIINEPNIQIRNKHWFSFLMKHAEIVFYYKLKKSMFKFFSYYKHSKKMVKELNKTS